MDDFHLIAHPKIIQQLNRFLDYLPSFFRVIITSRTRSDLHLSMRQVKRQLLMISQNALQFSEEEVDVMLRRRFTLALSPQKLHQLYQLTRGWAAAIQLAACRLTQVDGDLKHLLFTENDDELAEYLMTEVFEYLPAILRKMLPKLGLFTSFSIDFCENVMPECDASQLINALHQSNLPHSCMTVNNQKLYFLHDIILRWLPTQNMQKPDADCILRGVDWYLDQGFLIEALELLARYKLWEKLSMVLAANQKDLVQLGHFHRGTNVIQQLPDDWVAINPWVLYLNGFIQFAQGNATSADRFTRQALSLCEAEQNLAVYLPEDKDERLALKARCYFLLSHLARLEGRVEESIELSTRIDISRLVNQPHLYAWSLKGQGADAFLKGELEIMNWLKTGKKNADIAHQLKISPSTVKTHLRNIYGKLGASNKLEAIKLAGDDL